MALPFPWFPTKSGVPDPTLPPETWRVLAVLDSSKAVADVVLVMYAARPPGAGLA